MDLKRKPRKRRMRRDKCEDCGLYGYEAQSCSCGRFHWDGTEQRRINEQAVINHRPDEDLSGPKV